MVPLSVVFLAATTSVTPAPPTFSASVDMIRVSVVVQDPQHRYVTDLQQQDFTVFENGIQQELETFSHKKLATDLTLLLDGSDSMLPHLKEVYRAATKFVDTIQPDTVQIAHFAQNVRILQPPTDDMVETKGALAKLALFSEYAMKYRDQTKLRSKKPEDIVFREAIRTWTCAHAMCGGTALYTAVYTISDFVHKLSTEDRESRRQVIILLTDGEDTASGLTADNILKAVAQLEVPIYAVCLRARVGSDPLVTDQFLTRLAQETGGDYQVVQSTVELTSWYQAVADALQSQYQIAYTSTAIVRDGRWRPIQISIGRPGYSLRHKLGYYAPCDTDQPCAQKKKQ